MILSNPYFLPEFGLQDDSPGTRQDWKVNDERWQAGAQVIEDWSLVMGTAVSMHHGH
jgi:hypothetical protein